MIPPTFHFVWFGPQLPEFAHWAMESALDKNPGSSVRLWHGSELKSDTTLEALVERGLTKTEIDVPQLCRIAADGGGAELAQVEEIYRRLEAPAARSNVVRLLALYVHGGIYLDTDTLSLRDLSPLRQHGAFCGLEHVLWPAGRAKLDPRAIFLGEVRRLSAAISGGHRVHAKLLRFYSQAANNAVLGSAPGHHFVGQLLESIARVPEAEWTKRFRLGTHLLQEGLKAFNGDTRETRMEALTPEAFYPVGPVASRHYFRTTDNPELLQSELVPPETYLIHWYASVAELNRRGASHVRVNQHREVFSRLCAPYVG